MGKALLALCVVCVGCQPLYGPDAPKPKNPKPISHHDVAVVTETHYNDNCVVDFSGPPAKKRQTAASTQLVVTADGLDAAAAQDQQTKVANIKRSIELYGEALVKDPYNADATLKLALAYDKVLHRGCALAMLKRLAKLADNQTFKANPTIDRVVDNAQWFKGYRTEALRAVGH